MIAGRDCACPLSELQATTDGLQVVGYRKIALNTLYSNAEGEIKKMYETIFQEPFRKFVLG